MVQSPAPVSCKMAMRLKAPTPLLATSIVIALYVITVSAHQNEAFNDVQIPRETISKFGTDFSFDGSRKSPMSRVISLEDHVSDTDLKRQDADIRNWLLEKSREHVEYKIVDGLADTPLGNISQQCYNDVTKFFTDFDELQTYALKMWSSWGDTTPWFKALYTGTARSTGAYELCKGLTKEDDGLPFGVQFCWMKGPLVLDFFIPAVIGSCWSASCSDKDLEIAHKTFLGPGGGEGITYDCTDDIPWSAGAIGTLSLLSFFALLVLIGSVYHVVSHENITNILEELKHAKSKHVYEQYVHDEKPKIEQETTLSTGQSTEKCVGAGESDINYPTEEPPIYEELTNGGIVSKEVIGDSTPNGTTKLKIEDENEHGSEHVNGHKLALVDRLLMSFSLFYNTEKIFSTSSPSSMLSFLNGIRVLSMWWVILGHAFAFPSGFRYGNPQHVYQYLGKVAFSPIQNGTYSVDTFFVLSGFLVTYITLKELKKRSGRINWGLFYFHRFWRITPLYMVVMAIMATLPAYWGEGEGKDDYITGISGVCRKYWWTHLVYINNLYPFPGDLGQQCLGHAWYLANDMQFFIISPVIVYCLYKSSKWGVNLIALLCAASFGSTAYVCWYWGLPAYGFNTPFYNNRTETTPGLNSGTDFIYGKPYVRIQVYLVGMMLGFIVYKMNGKPYKLNKLVNLLGWAVSAALACSAIYGLAATDEETAQWAAIAYNCLTRFSFALAVAWVMFACITGNGGYINSFLSWNGWTPLAKLNFSAYLIHPVILYQVLITKKSLIHFNYVEGSYWFIANLVASYAVAYILSILVKGPTVGMEKAVLGRFSDENRKSKKINGLDK